MSPRAGLRLPAATPIRYAGLSERTVRTWLGRLDAAGIIGPVRPGHRRGMDHAHRPPPAGWDLNLGLVRDDLCRGRHREAGAPVFRPFPPVLAGCLLVGRRLGGDGLLRSAMVAKVVSTLFR